MRRFLIFINTDELISRLNDINSLLTEEEKNEIYETDIAVVTNIDEFKEKFKELKPDVLFFNCTFKTDVKIKFLKEFQKINKNNCKLLVSYKGKEEREKLARLKIAHRLFSYKVSNEAIHKALIEMGNNEILSNTSNNNDIDDFVKLLRLNINSHITEQFVFALRILLNKSSYYLLWEAPYNIIYLVSKIERYSAETIRKNIYDIRDKINSTISADIREAVFHGNDLSDLKYYDFLEFCVEYVRELTKSRQQ